MSHAIRHGIRNLLAAIGAASLILACADSPSVQNAKAARQMDQAIAMMMRAVDADSLAAAALLNMERHRGQSLSLVARATAAAPDRADLLWLHVQVCAQAPACDPQPLEIRLRELDPANGAGWMNALARAYVAKDEAATDVAIAAMGRSDRMDVYWTTLIAHMSRATSQTKAISLQEAVIAIAGFLAAEAIPAYTAASAACKGERLHRTENIAACRGVANAFMRGDTYITEMIGIAIAKRAWPEDSPQWKRAVEARRAYEYRSKFWPKADVWSTSHEEEYLRLCAENRREQDVFRAQLIEAGENPDPPAQ
jgi:hypothetical protein